MADRAGDGAALRKVIAHLGIAGMPVPLALPSAIVDSRHIRHVLITGSIGIDHYYSAILALALALIRR